MSVLVLAGCGEANERTEPTSETGALAGFAASEGSDIPEVEVSFSMWPYGDTTIGYIGIESGFFEEVGISLDPAEGQTQLADATPGLLLSSELDIAIDFIPSMVQRYQQQPEIKMVQVLNSFIGNYVLAAPGLDATPVEEYVDEGMSFEDATAAVVADMEGTTVALSDMPSPRNLLNGMLGIADGTVETFGSLEVLEDPRIVQLAIGGGADYALVSGAAQAIQLLDLGYVPVFSFEQLADNLPAGDPNVALGLGHVGLSVTDTYLEENLETVLRFMSVYWRIIDYIQNDPEAALEISLPHLNSATGYDLTVADSITLFQQFYQLISFDDAAAFFDDPANPLGLDAVYDPQIQEAVDAGVITTDIAPTDFVIAGELYGIMLQLKEQYEDLAEEGSADQATLDAAAQQAEHRNYLDAYRILAAAQ